MGNSNIHNQKAEVMFALIDCNNFYASCERVFAPNLIGKPIVVLSNNDGCVIARSNEAKEIGVPMGAPAFENQLLFKKHNVKVFSSNFALYGDMSHRVMTILSEYSPDIEIYSIDEAFLKFDASAKDKLHEFGVAIRQHVYKWTGIPISIGFAPTKALAKAANRIGKKYPVETNNCHVIDSEEKRIKALKWLKVEDVWGIGRQHSKKLNAIGVVNAYQFTMLDNAWVKKNMSVVGLRLKQDLEGKPTLDLDDIKPKKCIATTRSFESNYTEYEQIKERVITFAVSCAEKLRAQNSCCNSLMVFLHTNYHRKDLPRYCKNIVLPLPFPTNSSIELADFAEFALKKIFKQGYHYKKAGVIVMDFAPEDNIQTRLFDNRNEKHIPVMKAIDSINRNYGRLKIGLASQDMKRMWKMRQEKLSPRYTTKLTDIIIINCK